MGTRQPQLVKTAVIAKKTMGVSNSEIARELGVHRDTVRRVLNEAEYNSLIAQGKSTLFEAIPEAARVYAEKVKADATEAKEFLERITVLPAKAEAAAVNNGVVINLRRDPETPQIVVPDKPAL